MNTFQIDGCSVTVLPVIKGLVSEYDRVSDAITSDYDCIAVSLGLEELPHVEARFRKGRGTRDQIAKICWIIEKAREFQKNIYFCFIFYA